MKFSFLKLSKSFDILFDLIISNDIRSESNFKIWSVLKSKNSENSEVFKNFENFEIDEIWIIRFNKSFFIKSFNKIISFFLFFFALFLIFLLVFLKTADFYFY